MSGPGYFNSSNYNTYTQQNAPSGPSNDNATMDSQNQGYGSHNISPQYLRASTTYSTQGQGNPPSSQNEPLYSNQSLNASFGSNPSSSYSSYPNTNAQLYNATDAYQYSTSSTVPGYASNSYSQPSPHMNPPTLSNRSGCNFSGAPSQSNSSIYSYNSISCNPPRTATGSSDYSNLSSVMNGAGQTRSNNIGNAGDLNFLQDAIDLLAQSPIDNRSSALGTSNRATIIPAPSSGISYQHVLASAPMGSSNSEYYNFGSTNLYSASGSGASYGVNPVTSPIGGNRELSAYNTAEAFGNYGQSANYSTPAYNNDRHPSSNAHVGNATNWGSSSLPYDTSGQSMAQLRQGSVTSPAVAAASDFKSAPASSKANVKPTPKTKPKQKPKQPRKPKSNATGKASLSESGTPMDIKYITATMEASAINQFGCNNISATGNGIKNPEQWSQSSPRIIGAPAGFPVPKSKLANSGQVPQSVPAGENNTLTKSPATVQTVAKKAKSLGNKNSGKNVILTPARSNSPKKPTKTAKNTLQSCAVTTPTPVQTETTSIKTVTKSIEEATTPPVLKPIDCTTENLRNLLTKSRTEKPMKSNTSVKSTSTQPKYFALPTDFSPSHSYRAAAAYSLLRTLSTELRLSPFSMQSFLNALTLPIPCRLLGEVHVRILRVLYANIGMGTYSKHGAGQNLTIRRKKILSDLMTVGKMKGESCRQNPFIAEEVISKRGGDNLFFLDNTSWPLFYEDYATASEAKFLDETDDDTFIDLRSAAMLPMDEIDLNPRAPPPRFLSRGNVVSLRNGSKIDSSAKRRPSEGWINRCPAGPLGERNRLGRFICCPFHIVTAVKRAMRNSSLPSPSNNSPIATTPNNGPQSRPEKSTKKRGRGRPPKHFKSTQGKRQNQQRKGKRKYAESSSSSESDGSDDDEEFPAPKIRRGSRSDVKLPPAALPAPDSVGGLCKALNLDGETPTSSDVSQNGVPKYNVQSPSIVTSSLTQLTPTPEITKTPISNRMTLGTSSTNSIVHSSIKQNTQPRQFEPTFVPPIPPPPIEENALLVADDVKKDLERYFLEGDLFRASKPIGIKGVKVEKAFIPSQSSNPWKCFGEPMGDLEEVRLVMDSILKKVEDDGKITNAASSTKSLHPRIGQMSSLFDVSVMTKSKEETDEIKSVLEEMLDDIENKELNESTNRMKSGNEGDSNCTQRASSLLRSFTPVTKQISSSSNDQSTLETDGNTVSKGILQKIENNGACQTMISAEANEEDCSKDRREGSLTDIFITHDMKPINHLRRGVPYHHLSIDDKLTILEFLLDEILTVEEFSDELLRRHLVTDHFPELYGKPPLQNEFDNMYNADECKICGMEGDLLCCDGCPGSFHRACLNLGHGRLPEGKWLCHECRLTDSSKLGPLGADSRPLLGWFGIDNIEDCHFEAQVPVHPTAPPSESLPNPPSNSQPQTIIIQNAPSNASELSQAAQSNVIPKESTQASRNGEIPSITATGATSNNFDCGNTTPENGVRTLVSFQASTPEIFKCRIPRHVEFLVTSGKVFARYRSSHEPFDPLNFSESPVQSSDNSSKFQHPSPPIPLNRPQLRELLKLLGPKICLSLPWRHIKFEPKNIWSDIAEKEDFTEKCLVTYQFEEKNLSEKNPEIYNPISYINNYRRAPPIPIVKAHQGQFQCPVIVPEIVNYPTKVNALTNAAYDLTSDAINKARRIAYLDPVQSVRDKMIKLERCLCDACLLDESWGTRGYGMDEDGWKKKVQEAESIKSLSILLVKLVDACSGKVFCKEWHEMKANGNADELENLSADEASQEFSEVSGEKSSIESELTRRKWDRCSISDIIRLLRSDEGTMEKIFGNTLSSKKRGKSRVSTEYSTNDDNTSSPRDNSDEAPKSPASLQANLSTCQSRSNEANEVVQDRNHVQAESQNAPGSLQGNQPSITSKGAARDNVIVSHTTKDTDADVTKASAASSLKDSANTVHISSSTTVTTNNSMDRCGKCDECVQEDCGQCPNCLDTKKFDGEGKRSLGCARRKKCLMAKNNRSDGLEQVLSSSTEGNVCPVAIAKPKKKRVSRGVSGKSRRRSDRHNAMRNQIESFLKLNQESRNDSECAIIELKIDKLEKALASDSSESYWSIAGRRMFEPRGLLPHPVVKRLGRKAGSARAPFVAYETSYEVGETALCHYWRKKTMECVTFEDLVFCFRFLDSHIDKAVSGINRCMSSYNHEVA